MSIALVVPWHCQACGREVGGGVPPWSSYRPRVRGEWPQIWIYCETCAEHEQYEPDPVTLPEDLGERFIRYLVTFSPL